MEKQPTARPDAELSRQEHRDDYEGQRCASSRLYARSGGHYPVAFPPGVGRHYFVLEGLVTIMTRHPEEARTIEAGADYRILPGTAHLITNRSAVDCRFLLLQGVGRYDWVKADD
jgi:mannose-6-phosphate isomerase-like protein (cupin superfamily)